MNPQGRTRRVRRVRRRREQQDSKAHCQLVIPTGILTERVKQQIANGDTVSWEGEYRDD